MYYLLKPIIFTKLLSFNNLSILSLIEYITIYSAQCIKRDYKCYL